MSDHDNDDDINDENRFSSYRMITMMMFFMKMVRTQNGQKWAMFKLQLPMMIIQTIMIIMLRMI